eukprot:CAMPEP_0197557444 /NCGR_PEP_ID=MMETSP1320-20131121/17147_1 /TAXON_ID=91990 /ORGANISM="Bolidomonas sp., Strain RCC2347" /LENGTH=242 /DNA_ID=CAMNT_0043118685 /DNA_START=18 /DNA_END=746 /DNA_ORIENTATION=-
MKFFLIALLATSASAFQLAPAPTARSSAVYSEVTEEVVEAPAFPTVNGWTADPKAFCLGLPGSLPPVGNFDPLGFTTDLSVPEIKRFREAEVTHGRVAMLASLGYLVGESFHPLFGGQITGPANTHLAQVEHVAPQFFFALAIAIGMAETTRALVGWVPPVQAMTTLAEREERGAFGALLRDGYYPGDIGFDPLGLKPSDPKEFAEMQTKELQNGRLAMLAAAGMCVQEQVDGKGIFEHFGF